MLNFYARFFLIIKDIFDVGPIAGLLFKFVSTLFRYVTNPTLCSPALLVSIL